MKRYRVFHARRAGYKPRPVFLRRLQRAHPRVRVVWNRRYKRWILIEVGKDGKLHIIKVLAGHPNMGTIQELNQMSLLNRYTPAELRQWLGDEADRQAQLEASMESDKSDMIAEGSERLWSAANPRPMIVKGG